MWRFVKRGLAIGVALVLVAVAVSYFLLRRSLPVLSGERVVAVLANVKIERDALGSTIITAQSRGDAYFAQGFVHAQERFFEMDLSRRSGAGELAELFGAAAVPRDRAHRVHQMRQRLTAFFPTLPELDRSLLERYSAGVNAGLAALSAKPWAYTLLRAQAKPWQPVDTLLVNAAMAFNLQDDTNAAELANDTAKRALSPAAYAYLFNRTSQYWDAPLMEGMTPIEFPDPPMPNANELDFRTLPAALFKATLSRGSEAVRGSNSWAVGGGVTESGSAILANDMHLGLGVPSIWFRQQLRYPHAGQNLVVTGVSLPGAPGTVVGSNGHVAWGNTNSYGDWLDFVRLIKPTNGDATAKGDVYMDATGVQPISQSNEVIHVRGAADEQLLVRSTPFGPIVAKDSQGNELALAWAAHRAGAVDMRVVDFELSQTAPDLLAQARRAGMPHNNVIAADSAGHIGWTIGGYIPLRTTMADKSLPVDSTSLTGDVWAGSLLQNSIEATQVIDPPNMHLYSANGRVVNAAAAVFIGNGGYALGARATRIRDLLDARTTYFRESDMLTMQLDDQAPLLESWWQLLSALTAGQPRYAGVNKVLGGWNRRASMESVAYRVVRGFRAEVLAEYVNAFGAPVRAQTPDFTMNFPSHAEVMVWPILNSQAPHLLPPPHASYEAFERACLDRALAKMLGVIKPNLTPAQPNPAAFDIALLSDSQITQAALEAHPWGEQNTARIQHPLAKAVPLLSWWLDMPGDPLPGDTGHIVRAQGPAFGASERLSVSPGHEDKGIFHMPGGQSGHPLSPFYGAGHADWVNGNPTPLLPGKVAYSLTLVPAPVAH
jgi:penicillin G amidase